VKPSCPEPARTDQGEISGKGPRNPPRPSGPARRHRKLRGLWGRPVSMMTCRPREWATSTRTSCSARARVSREQIFQRSQRIYAGGQFMAGALKQRITSDQARAVRPGSMHQHDVRASTGAQFARARRRREHPASAGERSSVTTTGLSSSNQLNGETFGKGCARIVCFRSDGVATLQGFTTL